MRKLTLAILAIIASATAIAAPASAQVYTDGEARTANGFLIPNGGSGYGYNGYSSYNGGCQGAGAVVQIICTVSQISQQDQLRRQQRIQQQQQIQREALDQRTRQLDALARACQAGDAYSCQRTGGGDPRTVQIARALMDACSAGDRDSCIRAEQMMGGRQTAQDQGYRRR